MTLLQPLCLWAALTSLLLSACMHPISEPARERVDPAITSAMISENPQGFLDRQILLGGVVIALEAADTGCTLELMEWQLNRWGEPAYLDDSGRRFLIESPKPLDPSVYEPGTLVTLSGIVAGQETRKLDAHDYDYPVLTLTEIHLWETPFRYGIHRNQDPAFPNYIGGDDGIERHPYDPGYSVYPYTPYWYRFGGH